MALKKCPVCGEKYSDTYRDCPFCEEEEALAQGERIYRSGRGGKRAASRRNQPSLLSPILVAIILLLAALLVYLLFGDKIMERFGGAEDVPGVEDTLPDETVDPDTSTDPVEPQVPDVPDVPDDTGGQTEDDPAPAELDYTAAMDLPKGLTLTKTDFTLKNPGENYSIGVTGGNGTYTWFSQNDAVATVDADGKVVAVSGGTVNVVVTDGKHKGVCVVRCDMASQTSTPSGNTGDSGTLKTGSAIVINGGNGVRVRSGPGTDYEILASVPNGASVRIVESAGSGWYKITFSGVGGANATGYMKGEFLKND